MSKLPYSIIIFLIFLGLFFLSFANFALGNILISGLKLEQPSGISIILDLFTALILLLMSTMCFSILFLELRDRKL